MNEVEELLNSGENASKVMSDVSLSCAALAHCLY